MSSIPQTHDIPAAETIPRADLLRATLAYTGLALIALYLVVSVVRNVTIQGDFRAYMTAAQAVWQGLDPYLPEHLAALSQRPVQPFVYPAASLVLFLPVAAIPWSAALWISAKLALLVGLVVFWARKFLPRVSILAIALVTVFGWNGSALWDIRTGNVALVECALLWGAFGFFVLGRRSLFAGLVIAAACFKLMPAAFLLLLLVPTAEGRPSLRLFTWSLVALAVLILTPMLIGPGSHWEPFFGHVPDANILGRTNPSALGFITVLFHQAGTAEPLASRLATGVYALYMVSLLALSYPFFRQTWRQRDATRWVMAAVFLYVLLLPRPMAYGFVMLAPVPLFFAPRPFSGHVGALLLALVLSAQGLTQAASLGSSELVFIYAPTLLTLCIWVLVVSPGANNPIRQIQ